MKMNRKTLPVRWILMRASLPLLALVFILRATGQDKVGPDDVEAKRAWLFQEFPQMSLVLEPPISGNFYSLQKNQPPLPFNPHPELPVQVVSEWDLVLRALEATPPLLPTTNRLSGSFYTIQHRGDWPPLPGNPWKLPFWKLDDGFYIVDDRKVDYEAQQVTSSTSWQIRQG